MCYNVNWDAIFPEHDPKNHEWRSDGKAAEFVRVVRAIGQDIICLQEINQARDPADVGTILDATLPLGNGAKWHVHQGADSVIASRYPMLRLGTDTVPPTNREQAMALVDRKNALP